MKRVPSARATSLNATVSLAVAQAMSRARKLALLPALLVGASAACSSTNSDGASATTHQAIWNTGAFAGGLYSDVHKDILWKHGWGFQELDRNLDANGEVGLWHYHSSTNVDMRTLGDSTTGVGLTPEAEADFWGDNSKGVLLCGEVSNDCWAWKIVGDAIVGKEHVGTKGQNWFMAGTYDINGDGRKDVVWLDNQTGVHTWLMNGGQYQQVDSPLPSRTALGVGALDGATPYLVEEDNDANVRAVRIASTGALEGDEQFISGAQGPWYAMFGVGDVDGDGMADIFWRNRDTRDVSAWLMNGVSAHGYPVFGSASADWHPVEISDFDGDGRVDLLWRNWTTTEVSIWFMNPDMTLRDWSVIGQPDCTWAIATNGGYYSTTPCAYVPPPPPKCANQGDVVTSLGCCDTANDEPWGGRCEKKDPQGCGQLYQPWQPCCFHRPTQCDGSGVCTNTNSPTGYVCEGPTPTDVCGSTPAKTCTFECGDGVVVTGTYCSYPEALDATQPGCNVPSCR